MQIKLANPAASAPGRPGDRDRQPRPGSLRPADLRAPRSGAQQVRRRRPARRGAIFVEELDQVPDDVIVIFSAHGVSQAVRQEAAGRGLKVFDATCPLVTKVHIEVAKYSRDGRECILIGHAGHPEVEGTMGQYDASNGGAIYLVEDEKDVANLQVRNPEHLAFVTQTTLSMDDTSRHRRPACALPEHRWSAQGRHLLRHAKPPGRRQATGRRVRRGAGGRQPEQLQLQPPA
jgi:hypothetical protein